MSEGIQTIVESSEITIKVYSKKWIEENGCPSCGETCDGHYVEPKIAPAINGRRYEVDTLGL